MPQPVKLTLGSLITTLLPVNAKSEKVWAVRGEAENPASRSTNSSFRTFRDKTGDDDIMDTLAEIAEELGKDLDKLQYAGKTVTVKYKVGQKEDSRLSSIRCILSKVGQGIYPVVDINRQDACPICEEVYLHNGRNTASGFVFDIQSS